MSDRAAEKPSQEGGFNLIAFLGSSQADALRKDDAKRFRNKSDGASRSLKQLKQDAGADAPGDEQPADEEEGPDVEGDSGLRLRLSDIAEMRRRIALADEWIMGEMSDDERADEEQEDGRPRPWMLEESDDDDDDDDDEGDEAAAQDQGAEEEASDEEEEEESQAAAAVAGQKRARASAPTGSSGPKRQRQAGGGLVASAVEGQAASAAGVVLGLEDRTAQHGEAVAQAEGAAAAAAAAAGSGGDSAAKPSMSRAERKAAARAAKAAAQRLKNKQAEGAQREAVAPFEPANDKLVLFVGNLPFSVTESAQLESELKRAKVQGVARVHVERNNNGKPAGFGYLEFSSDAGRESLLQRVAPPEQGGTGKPVVVAGREVTLSAYDPSSSYRSKDGKRNRKKKQKAQEQAEEAAAAKAKAKRHAVTE